MFISFIPCILAQLVIDVLYRVTQEILFLLGIYGGL